MNTPVSDMLHYKSKRKGTQVIFFSCEQDGKVRKKQEEAKAWKLLDAFLK